MGPDVVAAVTEIAARQHGAISTAQLREVGLTPKAQRAAVHSGWLVTLDRRVVALRGSPDTWRRRLHAGLLSLGAPSWVSHEAAAALHRFDRAIAESVEFAILRSRRGRTCAWPVHTTDELGPHDIVTIDGLRCTSATRTILDLAHARIPKARLEAAIDSAVRSGRTAPIVLERRLSELRGPGRWGAASNWTPCSSTRAASQRSNGDSSHSFVGAGCRDPRRKWSTAATADTWRGSTSCSVRSASSWRSPAGSVTRHRRTVTATRNAGTN